MEQKPFSYWRHFWKQFFHHRLGTAAASVVVLFCLVGIYAPILASSRPLLVIYDGTFYFPLFRYLFYPGFFSKPIDIFFNLLMLTFPLLLLAIVMLRKHPSILKRAAAILLLGQVILFLYFSYRTPRNPAADPSLIQQRQSALQQLRKGGKTPDWNFSLRYMNPYAKLNLILLDRHLREQHHRLQSHGDKYADAVEEEWLTREASKRKAEMVREGIPEALISVDELRRDILQETPPEVLLEIRTMPTLWYLQMMEEENGIKRLQESPESQAKASIRRIEERKQWLEKENEKISLIAMPLIRDFHWEEDAGGEQKMNRYLPWWELTRINRKDLVAALIFGVRISLVVGIMAVTLALFIGIPVGSIAGYYGGKLDIFVSRLLEIWESMPILFMLLLVVGITQNKSIFIVILVIGVFGWTGFSRYIRGEFFKQRNLPYVEACHALGFRDGYIIFSHILPNAIPPILTLLPFAIMGAITSEASLSFLGLGEEGSCSWGVLMDEGRTAFPGESYLLWPPAILLTVLLVAIALVGDAIRDVLDPKMHR